MLRQSIGLSAAVLLCVACSGPLVSERFQPGTERYEGTAHGIYCLPKRIHTLTVVEYAGTPPAAPAEDSAEDLSKLKPKPTVVQATELYYEVSVTQTTEPDWSEVYRLGLDEDVLAKDKITVKYVGHQETAGTPGTGPVNCLLQSISADVTDRSGEAAQMLTDIIFTAYTGGVRPRKGPDGRTLGGGGDGRGALIEKRRFVYAFELSPSDVAATKARVNKALTDGGFPFHFEMDKITPDAVTADSARGHTRKPGKSYGVVARPFNQYRVVGYHLSKTGKYPISAEMVFSPNGLPPYLVAIDRSAFVTRKTTINFLDGHVTHIDTDKQESEAVGFLKIPLDIVTAIVEAPAALFTNEQALLAKERSLLREREGLIDDRQKFINKQKGETPKEEKPKEELPSP